MRSRTSPEASYDVIVLDRDLPGHPRRRGLPDPGRRRLPEPSADAHRGRHGRRPGRGPGLGRRRLPGQAVRLRRAGRPHPSPGPASHPVLPPTLVHGDLSLDTARRVAIGRAARWPSAPRNSAVLEHLLAAEGRGRDQPRNSSTRCGTRRRTHSPTTVTDDDQPPAGQARRPPDHRDRLQRLPDLIPCEPRRPPHDDPFEVAAAAANGAPAPHPPLQPALPRSGWRPARHHLPPGAARAPPARSITPCSHSPPASRQLARQAHAGRTRTAGQATQSASACHPRHRHA